MPNSPLTLRFATLDLSQKVPLGMGYVPHTGTINIFEGPMRGPVMGPSNRWLTSLMMLRNFGCKPT